MRSTVALLLLVMAGLLVEDSEAETAVYILSENDQQVITSTTLMWVPRGKNPKFDFENAVIGGYVVKPKDDGSEQEDPSPPRPIHVCRARVHGLLLAGQLRPDAPNCVVSQHGRVYQPDRYDVLINVEGSARLSWKGRDKYTLNPPGAVTGGDEQFRNFIARRKAKPPTLFTYLTGKFNPGDNLGKYTLVNEADEELEFEDGEVLVETQPKRYELRSLKLDHQRARYNREPRLLGEVTLKNDNLGESTETSKVDTVISYNYTYSLSWGTGHGLEVGLNFDLIFKNATRVQGAWGLPKTMTRVDVQAIEAFLAPGTAVNVTLRGNYVHADTPYTAVVVAFYEDSLTKERVLKDSQRESRMRDVVPEFGRVYFLHNNSYVPTTTTTTTSTTTTTTTTSTTTKATTTSTTTEEMAPLTPPELQLDLERKKTVDEVGSDQKKHENSSVQSDDTDALSLKKKAESSSAASLLLTSAVMLLLTTLTATMT